ncbi:MAG TPA: hypothetical protein VMZ06_07395 [Candidatus Bathyarchaeia archaeon]|nr:hypothetical protein [Candidatus Bathyarchaeia archaeon]
MERRQLFVVVITVLILVGALVVTAYFSEGDTAKRSGGLKFRQGPRKERTVVNEDLYNKIVGAESVPDSRAAVNKTGDDNTEANDKPRETPVTPEEAAAAEALNALTPQQGIDRLSALLATLDNLENASRLYTALGTLYTQTGEAGVAPAEEAFAVAKKLAHTYQDRHRAALAHVTALSARGDIEAAMREAADAIQPGDPYTISGMQLAVAQGKLYEQQGAPDQAETAYKKAMEDALAAQPVLHNDALNVYRQACLSLVQLYRKTGREPAANSLVLKMKNDLARYERTAARY